MTKQMQSPPESSATKRRLLLSALGWGGKGAIISFVIMRLLFFAAPSLLEVVERPLERFNIWLRYTWHFCLMDGHNGLATVSWLFAYSLMVGFVLGLLLRFLIAGLRRLFNRDARSPNAIN